MRSARVSTTAVSSRPAKRLSKRISGHHRVVTATPALPWVGPGRWRTETVPISRRRLLLRGSGLDRDPTLGQAEDRTGPRAPERIDCGHLLESPGLLPTTRAQSLIANATEMRTTRTNDSLTKPSTSGARSSSRSSVLPIRSIFGAAAMVTARFARPATKEPASGTSSRCGPWPVLATNRAAVRAGHPRWPEMDTDRCRCRGRRPVSSAPRRSCQPAVEPESSQYPGRRRCQRAVRTARSLP